MKSMDMVNAVTTETVEHMAYVYRPGNLEGERIMIALPARPGNEDLNQAIRPLIDAEDIEHVRVLFRGKPADMFINEHGHRLELPLNEGATRIYWTAHLQRYPDANLDDLSWIAGPAVVFGRQVWS